MNLEFTSFGTMEIFKIATANEESIPGLLESRPRPLPQLAVSPGPLPHTRSY